MDKTRSAFGDKRELKDNKGSLLSLSYSRLVRAHNNHNIAFKLQSFYNVHVSHVYL